MAEDATSESTDTTADASATEDDTTQAQQMLADAIEADDEKETAKADTPKTAAATAEKKDGLGDAGKRALAEERKARRDAEKKLADLNTRLKTFEDRDKTELEKAIERAETAEQGATSLRVANARLMAAATHNLDPDLIDLLGDGTDEEIDKRAQLLAEKFAAAAPVQQETKPTQTRPVESLTAGARPSGDRPTNPNDFLRAMADRTRGR